MSYTIPAWRTTTKVGSTRTDTKSNHTQTNGTSTNTSTKSTKTNTSTSNVKGTVKAESTSGSSSKDGVANGVKKKSVYSKPRQDAEMELVPFPDLFDLFAAYDQIYFNGVLTASGVYVRWSNRMTSCAGICRMGSGIGIEIALSEPLLQMRSSLDFKETLLHEMIHALDFLQPRSKRDHDGHGGFFQRKQNEINTSRREDPYKPASGYHITVYHSWTNEVDSHKRHHWQCSLCGHVVKRTMNRPPTEKDCRHYRKDGSLWKLPQNATTNKCGDPKCFHHNHMRTCPRGEFVKITHPESKTEREKRVRDQEKKAADDKGGIKKHKKKPKVEGILDPKQTALDFKPIAAATQDREGNAHTNLGSKRDANSIDSKTFNGSERQIKNGGMGNGITYMGTSTGPMVKSLGRDDFLNRRKGIKSETKADGSQSISTKTNMKNTSGMGTELGRRTLLAKGKQERQTPGEKVIDFINLDSSDEECVSVTHQPAKCSPKSINTNTQIHTTDTTPQTDAKPKSHDRYDSGNASVFSGSGVSRKQGQPAICSNKISANSVKTSWGTGFVLGDGNGEKKTCDGTTTTAVPGGTSECAENRYKNNRENVLDSQGVEMKVDGRGSPKGLSSLGMEAKVDTRGSPKGKEEAVKGSSGSASIGSSIDEDKSTRTSTSIQDSSLKRDGNNVISNTRVTPRKATPPSKSHVNNKASLTVTELWGVKTLEVPTEAERRRSEDLVMSVAMVTRERAVELLAACDGSAEKAIDKHYS